MANPFASFNLPFSETRKHAKSGGLKDKVVLITGAASGFGKALAIELAGFGAKLIICDINSSALELASKEIEKAGGETVSQLCNVASWEEQLSLFQAGFERFGKIDIIVANAGISEKIDDANSADIFPVVEQDLSAPPPKPSLRVTDINLTGVFYSMRLGFHYLRRGPQRPGRAITCVGSMASFDAIPTAPQYSASKAGVLGLVRSGSDLSNAFLRKEQIRVSMIAPFFALTNLVTPPLRRALADVPLATVDDVVGTLIHSFAPLDSTSNPPRMNGQVYTVPDTQGTYVLPSRISQLLLYKDLVERTSKISKVTGRAVVQMQKELAGQSSKL